MDQVSPSCELLERRLALMRELANSLEQVQSAVVRSDLAGIDGHTVRQRELCGALRWMQGEALEVRSPIGGQPDSKLGLLETRCWKRMQILGLDTFQDYYRCLTIKPTRQAELDVNWVSGIVRTRKNVSTYGTFPSFVACVPDGCP